MAMLPNPQHFGFSDEELINICRAYELSFSEMTIQELITAHNIKVKLELYLERASDYSLFKRLSESWDDGSI